MKKILGLIFLVFFACHRSSPEKPLKLGLIEELSPEKQSELNRLIKTSVFFKEKNLKLNNIYGIPPHLLLRSPSSPEVIELEWKNRSLAPKYMLFLNPYLERWIVPWIYAERYFQVGRFEEDYYLLPFRYSWLGFFYSSSILTSPPASWEELEEICTAHPSSMGLDFSRPSEVLKFILSLIWEFGGDEFDLNNSQTKSGLYFLARLKDCFSPYAENYNLKLLAEALKRGEIYFAFAEPELAKILAEKRLLGQEIFSAPLPGKKGVAYTSTLLGVNRKTENPELAVRLAIFLSHPRTRKKALEKELWLAPVILDKKDSFQNIYSPFLEMVSRLQPVPYPENFSALAEIYQEIFAQIVFRGRPVELVVIDYQLPLRQIKLGLFGEKK